MLGSHPEPRRRDVDCGCEVGISFQLVYNDFGFQFKTALHLLRFARSALPLDKEILLSCPIGLVTNGTEHVVRSKKAKRCMKYQDRAKDKSIVPLSIFDKQGSTNGPLSILKLTCVGLT